MRIGSLNAAGKWAGVIVASACGARPPGAAQAYQRALADAARNPAPLSVRDSFGPDPDLSGYEVYVHRDVAAAWGLLLIGPNGSGAQILSGALRRTCIRAAAWMADQGAAVTILSKRSARQ